MLELATWTAVLVLGPGAVAIFVWFLADLRRILAARGHRQPGEEEPGPGA